MREDAKIENHTQMVVNDEPIIKLDVEADARWREEAKEKALEKLNIVAE